MRIIAVVAVAAAVLFDVWGAGGRSTFGGPMMLLLLAFVLSLATGIYSAVQNKRGPLGYIGCIAVALIGSFVALSAVGMAMEAIIPRLGLDGPLATSRHPLRYLASPLMMLATVFGAWALLQFANRLYGSRP